MHRNPHILNASTNLLGISFIIIGGLKLTNSNADTLADQGAWVAALLYFISALTSYFSIRNDGRIKIHVTVADFSFIAGLFILMGSVLIFAIGL
jgi:uncharacterized paraquat-inducible protein A